MSARIRHSIEQGFSRFGDVVYRYHWLVLLVVVVLVGALASQMRHLHIDTSTEGFLHASDPVLIRYNQFREVFGRDEMVVLTVSGGEIFSLPFLTRLKALHEALRDEVPYLDDITSLVNARNTRGADGELVVEDLLEQWPQSAAELAVIKARAMANPVYRNMLISADGQVTTLVLKTDNYTHVGLDEVDVMAGFDEPGAQDAAPEVRRPFLSDEENSELVAKAYAVAARFDSPEFHVQLAGSPVVSGVLKREMKKNMGKFMLAALLFISLLLALLFKRVSGVVLPMLTVILSLVSTLGLMGALGIPIKLPTQILPSFLLAVGVGASVHLLAIFYRELQESHFATQRGEKNVDDDHKRAAIVSALGHSGLAIVMTSLTTAAGLASFAGAAVSPVADLGQAAAMGVLISLLFTLVLIPALLSLFPVRAKQGEVHAERHQRMDALLARIAELAVTRSRTIILVSLILMGIGVAGALQVKFSHKPFEWLPLTEPARIANDFINARLKGASSVEVLVDSGTPNGLYAPALLQGLDRLGPQVEAIEQGELYVGKSLSLADILKETNRALHDNDDAYYTIPDDRALIAQELLLFENSGSDDMSDFVDSQFQTARFTVKMPWVDATLYRGFTDTLQQIFEAQFGDQARIEITGMAALLGRTMHATIISMAHSYLIAAAVITLMMILLIGDIKIGLVSMIPNIAPILLTVGLMGWFGLPLDLFTILIGSIAIGLAVDDTIHFMHNYRRYHHDSGVVLDAVRKTLMSTGRAMFTTTLVLAGGFFLYAFASLSNLVNFGLLTGFAIIMALLADFFLAPALMAELHRSHLIDDDSDY